MLKSAIVPTAENLLKITGTSQDVPVAELSKERLSEAERLFPKKGFVTIAEEKVTLLNASKKLTA